MRFHFPSIATLSAALLMVACAAPRPWPDVDAGVIAVLSDGDHAARTYADGQLPPADPARADVLTIARRSGASWSTSSVPVSNSVTAAPEVLAVTPDGRSAFVVERLGGRAPGATLARELLPGRRLTAIDIETVPPRVLSAVDTGVFPEALAVNPTGTQVAVVSNDADAAWLHLVAWRDRRFGHVRSYRLDALGVAGRGTGPRAGVTATNVQWHPSGRFVAVNLNTSDQVAFFELSTGDGPPARWGTPVATGRDPFVGRFTPDGRHYLTADWGRDLSATSLEGRLPQQPSAVGVVRLGDPDAGLNARHEHLGSVPSGLSSEGLAVSPDGRWVATVDMRGSAFPPGHPRYHRHASVTLLRFEAATGSLRKVAHAPLEGALPEGGVFDRSSRHFLATVFEPQPGGPPAGLAVFQVSEEGGGSLVPLGRWAFPVGAHHVDLGP